MAFNPLNFLQSGLNQFTPQGGWGIPNIGALQNLLRQQSAAGLRRTNAQDLMGFQRAGLGRSVASAFAPGTRGIQANQSLMCETSDIKWLLFLVRYTLSKQYDKIQARNIRKVSKTAL